MTINSQNPLERPYRSYSILDILNDMKWTRMNGYHEKHLNFPRCLLIRNIYLPSMVLQLPCQSFLSMSQSRNLFPSIGALLHCFYSKFKSKINIHNNSISNRKTYRVQDNHTSHTYHANKEQY